MGNKLTMETEEQEKETTKMLEDFKRNSKMHDYSLDFWKPSPGDANQIRIMAGVDGASFHLKMGRHWLQYPDGWEVFVCNLMTHQKPCPACEEFNRLTKLGQKSEAERFKPEVKGIFNVIDRNDEAAGVRLWEAPPKVIWEEVIEIVKGRSPFSNLIGTQGDPFMGRDLNIKYDPKSPPATMYAIRPLDTTKLGSSEQIAKWTAEAKPLRVEVLYPEIDYEAATIKTFGTAMQRTILQKQMREAAEEADAVGRDEFDAAEAEEKKSRKSKTIERAEAVRAKHEKAGEESAEDVKKNVDAIRARRIAKLREEANALESGKGAEKEPSIEDLKKKLKTAEGEEFNTIFAKISELQKQIEK